MHADYAHLSGQYASFLSALGGISITVLTIVLAIKSTGRSKLFSALVSALVVATLACFVGAHLMSQTAALTREKEPAAQSANAQTLPNNQPDNRQQAANANQGDIKEPPPRNQPPPNEQKPLVARHFVYSSANVYFALMLISFAMMLLPKAYIKDGKDQPPKSDPPERVRTAEGIMTRDDSEAISTITKWVFYFVVGSAYFWSFYYYSYRFNKPEPTMWVVKVFVLGTLIIAAVWVAYLLVMGRFKDEKLRTWTFIIHIILISLSVCLFAFRAKIDEQPTILDISFFCAAIAISGASLWGLNRRLDKSGIPRNDVEEKKNEGEMKG
jgi:hypothetical protein